MVEEKQSLVKRAESLAQFDPKLSRSLIIRALKSIDKIGTKRVLLVDDEPAFLKFYPRILKRIGSFITFTAKDGLEGLKSVRQEKGDFDLVITNIRMPKINGYEMIRIIKKEYPDIPILIITGFYTGEGEKVLQELESEGLICGWFPKPFTVDELLNFITTTLISK